MMSASFCGGVYSTVSRNINHDDDGTREYLRKRDGRRKRPQEGNNKKNDADCERENFQSWQDYALSCPSNCPRCQVFNSSPNTSGRSKIDNIMHSR